jgi:hypothetical protein
VLILAAAAAFAACGGADAPHGPGPSPSPSVDTTPGPVVGRFLLRITPASSCNIGGSVSVPMLAAAAGASPYPGVQALLAGGGDPLEVELMSVAQTVRGGFGTTERGALGDDGTRLWMRAIGSGPLVRSADGRGEVTTGRLAGYVAFGFAAGPEGSLGACDSVEHTFTLRATP